MRVLLLVLLLSGCQSTVYQVYDAVNTVKIGDSYQTVVQKVGKEPYGKTCLTRNNRKVCAMSFRYTEVLPDSAIITFNESGKVVSVMN